MASIHPQIDVLTARIFELQALVVALDEGSSPIVVTVGASVLTVDPVEAPVSYEQGANAIRAVIERVTNDLRHGIADTSLAIAATA